MDSSPVIAYSGPISPFCDRLTVTVPRSHDAALRDVAAEFGGLLDGVVGDQPGLWRLENGGTFHYQARPQFASLEASGRALAALRASQWFGDYLSALAPLPVRVTRLDATADLPVRAAPALADLYARASRGGVRLGGWVPIPGSEVVQYLSRPLYRGEDMDTGTCYVPSRRLGGKRQYLTAYDKRQERLARGHDDPGPDQWLRIEASAARQKGATLADAWSPQALFFDIVSPDVLARPANAPVWSPHAVEWAPSPVRLSTVPERVQRALDGNLGSALLDLVGGPSGAWMLRQWLDRVDPAGSARPCRAPGL